MFNSFQQAAKAWPILTQRKNTITYGALAKELGIHHRSVKYVLREIQDYCLREKLPPLTILGVDRFGKVGKGFIAWDADDIQTGRQLVYSENWSAHLNPFNFAIDGSTLDDIAADIVIAKVSGEEAYARVKVRGMVQVLFRKTMLRVYRGRCAISGDTGDPLMQAAHIVPWSKCGRGERLDPRNGILLSIQYHRMFDLDWIRITSDYRIQLNHEAMKHSALTAMQHKALSALKGMPLRLPVDPRHHPSPETIMRRYADKKVLQELRSLCV